MTAQEALQVLKDVEDRLTYEYGENMLSEQLAEARAALERHLKFSTTGK